LIDFRTRHALYELAVTNALPMAGFLFALHGHRPRVLREDFAGTGALARGWCQYGHDRGLAGQRSLASIAVDLNARVFTLGRRLAAQGTAHPAKVTFQRADVLVCADRADIIAATNFPVGYLHTRKALVAYLRHARTCLKSKGVFVCDMYGGSKAFEVGTTRQRVRAGPGKQFVYTFVYIWEQEICEPLTGMVTNHIHFELPARSRSQFQQTNKFQKAKTSVIRNAFTYRWRLWSIPELRDAMLEAGFRTVEVYDRLADGIDGEGNVYVQPLGESDRLDDPFVVYVAARK